MALTDKPEVEYIDGRRVRKVSPKRTHALVQLAIAMILKRCAERSGQVGTEWRFRLGVADGSQTTLVPDVAGEIRSPSFRPAILAEKISKYLATGTLIVLDIDPLGRQITAHATDAVRTFASSTSFAHPLTPWLTFAVDEVFEDLDE